ncbi:unnamed protein product [Bursaphelenchus xylophilus]|uniref:(pine wood nematode) hypothetical protein n=1 Tax=Bursaphelenchus xylophilus TaxID=6326 RepID=A0A1I7SL07_BURXY|nr:unnamed protein product [Bursaphelenchus xylophilus]CAG9129321.1 unnamed protein product [Bursaphelenchus xylophilus]
MILLLIYAAILWSAIYYTVRYFRELQLIDGAYKKAVLITGCDSGFGNGLAKRCMEHGMTVFASCTTDEGRKLLTEECRSMNGQLHAFLMDVTSDEDVEKTRQFIEDTVGPAGLHAIVNNAGIAGEFVWDEWQPVEHYRKLFEVDTLGVIRVTHKFRNMLKKSRGRIVNVTSSFSVCAPAQIGPYAVAKYGVEAFSDTIRREYAIHGISVHIVEPGFLRTPMNVVENGLRNIQRAWDRQPEEVKRDFGEEFFKYTQDTTRIRYGFGSDPKIVVDAYFHALTAKHPRTRYRPGIDAKLFYIPSAHLPTLLQDWWFQMHPAYRVMTPKECKKKYSAF